jgi:hypothetical protein
MLVQYILLCSLKILTPFEPHQEPCERVFEDYSKILQLQIKAQKH